MQISKGRKTSKTTKMLKSTKTPEKPSEPSELRDAMRSLDRSISKDIPAAVAKAVEEGRPEALTDWMAVEMVLPTEEEWRAMDSASLPVELRRDLQEYKQAQDDLWELGKLVKKMPLQLPANVTQPLLSSGDLKPLTDWMEQNSVTPSEEAWQRIQSNPKVSKETMEALMTFKLPFAGEWTEWTQCPVTCGRGNKTRSRERTEPNCSEIETLFCNLPFCPVDCQWTTWGEWGSCSANCGEGTAVRYRKHSVEASESGRQCDGANEEERVCREDLCIEPTLPPEMAESLAQAGIEDEVAAEPAAFSASATDTIPFYFASLTEEDKLHMGHSLESTIPLCSYNGVTCSNEDFNTFHDEALGNCFTFNYAMPSKYKTERPGAQSGLRILLQTEQSDYLCSSQVGGFKVMIHNQTEWPFADSQGFNVAPGKTTSVSLSQIELRKLPPPYGSCTEAKSEDFLYAGSHTLEGCLRSCHQRRLIELCGCADPRFTAPTNATPCGVEKKLCLDYYRSCRAPGQRDNPLACDECLNPCHSFHFHLTASTSEMADTELLNRVCSTSHLDTTAKATCASDRSKKRNFALLKIYYEQLNLMRYQEVQDYETSNLISDFAGVMSIAVGASVVTMLEFVYALGALGLHWASGQRLSLIN